MKPWDDEELPKSILVKVGSKIISKRVIKKLNINNKDSIIKYKNVVYKEDKRLSNMGKADRISRPIYDSSKKFALVEIYSKNIQIDGIVFRKEQGEWHRLGWMYRRSFCF